MGFSLVGAAAVIGVSLLIAVEIFTGGVLPAVSDVNYSFKDMKDRAVDKIQADINITNTSTIAGVKIYHLNATVENTGSITLNTSDFVLLINGTSRSFTCSHSYLYPENIAYFNVSILTGTGTKRLKVIAPNGVSDYEDYESPL
jgi:archaellum component FlaF (FlaF/FlaG flagellin family)